jgi:hypothetical protein
MSLYLHLSALAAALGHEREVMIRYNQLDVADTLAAAADQAVDAAFNAYHDGRALEIRPSSEEEGLW